MLSVEDALRLVGEVAHPLPPCPVALEHALGLRLAEVVAADIDLPPFDKALVDGYAVRASDLANGDLQLRIGEEIPAGKSPTRPLGPREAALVMTGAPLPEGADAMVMIEKTIRDGTLVRFAAASFAAGQNRLPRGREIRAGMVVLEPGVVLNPPRIGLLASVGKTNVLAVPWPNVAILATGDELVEPSQVPGRAQIRNTNGPMLRALVESAGAVARTLPIAPDEPFTLKAALNDGLQSDVLLVSGGVSAGDFDLVPSTLAAAGVTQVFHKVRLKPGKPLWFGVKPAGAERSTPTLVFGLPGNPVSGIVGFLLFVRPALRALAGGAFVPSSTIEARLARSFEHQGDRPTYRPARLSPNRDGPPFVDVLDWAGSADLQALATADGFAAFPAGDRAYQAGEIVRFLGLG